MKVWQYHPNGCDNCGSDVEIYTDEGTAESYGYDGDPIRCVECGATGQWSVAAEDDAWVSWDEEEETP